MSTTLSLAHRVVAIALVTAAVLTATVQVIREPRGPVVETATTGAGPYGSGHLGPWQALSRRISPEHEIQDVLMFNGVVLIGDSITVQDAPAFERLLTTRAGDRAAVHAWSGQPSSAAVDALAAWDRRFGLPERIVLAVGSNDIFDPPAFAAQLERALRIAGPDRIVYWLTVHVDRAGQPAQVRAADRENSAWVNRQLDEAADRHPNLRIIRWAEFLTARPTRATRYLRDGLHTTVPLGQDARNELIVRALQNP